MMTEKKRPVNHKHGQRGNNVLPEMLSECATEYAQHFDAVFLADAYDLLC